MSKNPLTVKLSCCFRAMDGRGPARTRKSRLTLLLMQTRSRRVSQLSKSRLPVLIVPCSVRILYDWSESGSLQLLLCVSLSNASLAMTRNHGRLFALAALSEISRWMKERTCLRWSKPFLLLLHPTKQTLRMLLAGLVSVLLLSLSQHVFHCSFRFRFHICIFIVLYITRPVLIAICCR
ncbi:hypothetical protein BDR04DRAFT_1235126, partial [Suillus decipiens]